MPVVTTFQPLRRLFFGTIPKIELSIFKCRDKIKSKTAAAVDQGEVAP